MRHSNVFCLDSDSLKRGFIECDDCVKNEARARARARERERERERENNSTVNSSKKYIQCRNAE